MYMMNLVKLLLDFTRLLVKQYLHYNGIDLSPLDVVKKPSVVEQIVVTDYMIA